MRTLVWIAAAIVIAAAGLAFVYRDFIHFALIKMRVTPHAAFSLAAVPPAPDYVDPKAWAALPDQADGADLVIPGKTQDNQASAPVDVFFILPTTYLKNANWNGPIDDPDANRFISERMLPAEASVFNGCCKVYAPRYRQAAFAAFLDNTGSGEKAIEVAFRDVAAAFDYYLAHFNRGRPFILAGHSQGAGHLVRLVAEHVTGTELHGRMIAAYAIGWPINRDLFARNAPDVPVCSRPDQVGCAISWNTVGPSAARWGNPEGNICVNPLTWKTDGAAATAGSNRGALVTRDGVRDLQENAADAQCLGGRLRVTDMRAAPLLKAIAAAPINLGRDVYHVIDYPLFYMNIRENLAERIAHSLLADGPAPAGKPASPVHP